MQFNAPIPGQSLTDEPGNYAWERPPQIVDPNEAVIFHMERLSDREVTDSVLFLLEYGYPVDLLARTLLTGAVGEGVHSIDVSLIISPVIEEEIAYMGRTAGITFKETFADDKTDDQKQEEKMKLIVRKRLQDELGKGAIDEGIVEDALSGIDSPEENQLQEMQENVTPEQEAQQGELMDEGVEVPAEPQAAPAPSAGGQGLMSRGM